LSPAHVLIHRSGHVDDLLHHLLLCAGHDFAYQGEDERRAVDHDDGVPKKAPVVKSLLRGIRSCAVHLSHPSDEDAAEEGDELRNQAEGLQSV